MATRKEVEGTKQTMTGLCGLARALGYKDEFQQLANNDGTVVGDLLEFLNDNPGACEAVINWVLEEGYHIDGTPIDDTDDEEEDEEGEPDWDEFDDSQLEYRGEK